jgi:hypothetical protein
MQKCARRNARVIVSSDRASIDWYSELIVIYHHRPSSLSTVSNNVLARIVSNLLDEESASNGGEGASVPRGRSADRGASAAST